MPLQITFVAPSMPHSTSLAGLCTLTAPCPHPLRRRRPGTAALYLVDHETACIYMERVEGHSLKALLQLNSLQGAGEVGGRGGGRANGTCRGGGACRRQCGEADVTKSWAAMPSV